MADSSTTNTQRTVTATYSAPNSEPFRLESSFPAPADASVEQKSASLAGLRESITQVQADINRRLTANMEADKAREAGAGKAPADDDLLEQNYGEEVVNEDD